MGGQILSRILSEILSILDGGNILGLRTKAEHIFYRWQKKLTRNCGQKSLFLTSQKSVLNYNQVSHLLDNMFHFYKIKNECKSQNFVQKT